MQWKSQATEMDTPDLDVQDYRAAEMRYQRTEADVSRPEPPQEKRQPCIYSHLQLTVGMALRWLEGMADDIFLPETHLFPGA